MGNFQLLSLTLFRPTAHANDNISLLESGFNKEIDKNTAKLLKQEKELEAFQAIRRYLDMEAKGNLQPEAEVGQPTFKLFLTFKNDHVSNLGHVMWFCLTNKLRVKKQIPNALIH